VQPTASRGDSLTYNKQRLDSHAGQAEGTRYEKF
jgi:hypothetical protein